MERVIVTTSARPTTMLRQQAAALAAQLGCPLMDRADGTLVALSRATGADRILTVTGEGLALWQGGEVLRFHPGMATLRIQALQQGQTDRMAAAMGLVPGDTVLDCTLGFGADAIVASFVSGPDGAVTGLESSVLLAVLAAEGLQHYRLPGLEAMEEAMRRIRVIPLSYEDYLAKQPPASYDIVYFDPMFGTPVATSPGMNAQRTLANPAPVTLAAIAAAVRVARKRVVLKERQGSLVFNELGLRPVSGGSSSRVAYGCREITEGSA